MARLKKVSPDMLGEAIKQALDEYAIDTAKDLGEVAKELGENARRLLRETSPKNTGEYAKSWRIEVENTRLGSLVTVYSTKPGLPHLLENGHALRNGGRAPAIPHIAPVAEGIDEKFLKEVESRLS